MASTLLAASNPSSGGLSLPSLKSETSQAAMLQSTVYIAAMVQEELANLRQCLKKCVDVFRQALV